MSYKGAAQVFILFIRYLPFCLVSSNILVLLRYSFIFFHLYLFDGFHYLYSKIFIRFLFSERSYFFNRAIGLMSTVFTNGPGDRVSIAGRVIPKTLKMVLDAALLNTQYYKVRIKGKVEQSRERSSAHHLSSV